MSDPDREDIPAFLLRGDALIVADPDHPEMPVHWQVYHRETRQGARPTDLIVIVDYKDERGADGRHEFESAHQNVAVAA